MKRKTYFRNKRWVVFVFSIGLLFSHTTAQCTVFPANTVGCAWSENAGWVNFATKHSRVMVHDTHLAGFVWAENIGWIKLRSDGGGPYTDGWGVNKAPDGTLSGYAWSESVGWINFSPAASQVRIDERGYFHGFAWSVNVGWISFNEAQSKYSVKTGTARPYDFNLDDRVDVLYRHPDTGDILVWFMNEVQETSWTSIINPYGNPANHGLDWDIKGVGDFDGDGYHDILYRHSGGKVGVWLMIGINETTWHPLTYDDDQRPPDNDGAWDIKGVADFNHDGHFDVLYHHPGTGERGVGFMEGAKETTWAFIKNPLDNHGPAWDIKGVGDFDRDGKNDILYRHSDGRVGVWLMNDLNETTWQPLTDTNGHQPANHGAWDIKGVADYNNDGQVDVIYRLPGQGDIGVWLMNGATETTWKYIGNHGAWDVR